MQDNKKAFTLVELAVIVSIVALMTVVLFANYGKNSDTFALERAGQKLSQDLRRTQEMAMSGTDRASYASSNGYGIYFDNTSETTAKKYIIYVNNNTNKYYDSASVADSIKETINIDSGIRICSIKDNSTTVTTLSVSFEPPDPLTYINSNYTAHEATITLCVIKNNAETRTIKINNIGRIEVTNP